MLANRCRDPYHPFQLVIVRDMWLSGFDAPSLHALDGDKPMRDHGLMRAIARVSRAFHGQPDGLVADYLGFAPSWGRHWRPPRRAGTGCQFKHLAHLLSNRPVRLLWRPRPGSAG